MREEHINWQVAYWEGARDALLCLLEERDIGDQGEAEVMAVLEQVMWRLENAERERRRCMWDGGK